MTPKWSIVEVVWRDANFSFEGFDSDDDEYLVHTVGYMIRLDARWCYIAAECLQEENSFRAVTRIPVGKGIIRSLIIIRRGETKHGD